MDKQLELKLREHPDYEKTVAEVLRNKFDKGLMKEAARRAQRETQVEALYVILKLGGIKKVTTESN